MSKQSYVKQINELVDQLRAATGRPYWWNAQKGGTNVGAIHASHSAIYGGWVLAEAQNTGGAETLGPMGFPTERVPSPIFVKLLLMALWWAKHGHAKP